MVIKILPKGTLGRFFDRQKEITIEVPDGCTAAEALRHAGLDWETCPSFGFVAINGMRTMIDAELKDGDELKAYSKISGG